MCYTSRSQTFLYDGPFCFGVPHLAGFLIFNVQLQEVFETSDQNTLLYFVDIKVKINLYPFFVPPQRHQL